MHRFRKNSDQTQKVYIENKNVNKYVLCTGSMFMMTQRLQMTEVLTEDLIPSQNSEKRSCEYIWYRWNGKQSQLQ